MVFSNTKLPCDSCQLLPICIPNDMPSALIEALQQAVDQHQQLPKHETLVRLGDNLDYLYVLRTGSLKAWQVDELGHEHIHDFYFPGELIGLEAISKNQHVFNITALEKSHFCRINYPQLMQIIQKHPTVQTHLLTLASRQLSHHAQLLSHDAETRLFECLIDVCQRLKQAPSAKVRLSMSRVDLAHYLKLTPETISRLLTRLQDRGILLVQGKYIQLEPY